MMNLFEQDLLSFNELTWIKSSGDEEEPMVEDYYKLIAQFLMLMLAKSTSEKLIEFYDTYLRSPFSEMKKLILQDNFFDEIASSLEGCLQADLVIALLEDDKEK